MRALEIRTFWLPAVSNSLSKTNIVTGLRYGITTSETKALLISQLMGVARKRTLARALLLVVK